MHYHCNMFSCCDIQLWQLPAVQQELLVPHPGCHHPTGSNPHHPGTSSSLYYEQSAVSGNRNIKLSLVTPQFNCLKCLNSRNINLQWIMAENTFDIVRCCVLLTWIESSSISSVSPTACLSSGSDSDESWRFLFFFFKNVAGGLKNIYIHKDSWVHSFQF